MEDNKNWKKEFIIGELKKLYIECPECLNIQEEGFKCLTCDNEGGEGSVNVFDFLKKNKEILNENPQHDYKLSAIDFVIKPNQCKYCGK